MFIDIKPVRDEAFNCYYSVIATLCGHYGIDYGLVFIGAWGFDFVMQGYDKNAPIGPRISTSMYKYTYPGLLEKYVGIKLNRHDTADTEEALYLMRKEIPQGRPVIISSDLFWCPWNLAYQKYSFPHFYLAAGFDEENGSLICIDPYISSGREWLSLENFINGYKACITFELIEKKDILPVTLELVGNVVNHIIAAERSSGMFDKMRSLAHEIEEYLDFSIELNGYDDIYAVPLFDNIKALVSNRKAFAKTLYYLGDKLNINEFYSLAERMGRVADQWDNVRFNLMRLSMISDRKARQGKCALKIKEIADIEEELAYRITQIVNRNG